MGVSGMLVGTVMVGGERFYMFKLEFENQKRNFEVQYQVCFVMSKILLSDFDDVQLDEYMVN